MICGSFRPPLAFGSGAEVVSTWAFFLPKLGSLSSGFGMRKPRFFGFGSGVEVVSILAFFLPKLGSLSSGFGMRKPRLLRLRLVGDLRRGDGGSDRGLRELGLRLELGLELRLDRRNVLDPGVGQRLELGGGLGLDLDGRLGLYVDDGLGLHLRVRLHGRGRLRVDDDPAEGDRLDVLERIDRKSGRGLVGQFRVGDLEDRLGLPAQRAAAQRAPAQR